MELDDRVTLPSAEGIDLDLVLAGIGSRGAAVLIDLALQTAALFLVGLLAGQLGDAGVALLAVAAFVLLIGYPILAEGLASGRTVGKAAMRLQVVGDDGTPVTFLAAVIRNLVRVVDSLPGVYAVGLASVLASRRNQRLGDLAAGTLVIRRGGPQTTVGGRMDFAAGGSAGVDLTAASGWDLSAVSADELGALRAFLARRDELDPGHRADLAQTLAFQVLPKVAGVPLDGGPEAFIERVVAAKTSR